jgi:hypothetical protein
MTDHDRGQLDTSGAEVYESLFGRHCLEDSPIR